MGKLAGEKAAEKAVTWLCQGEQPHLASVLWPSNELNRCLPAWCWESSLPQGLRSRRRWLLPGGGGFSLAEAYGAASVSGSAGSSYCPVTMASTSLPAGRKDDPRA